MGAAETKEVKVARGLTLKVIALIVLLIVPMTYVNVRMWWHMGVTLNPFFGGRIGRPIYPPWGFIWFLTLIAAFSRWKLLSIPEIMVLVGSLFVIMDSGFYAFWLEPLALAYIAQGDPKLTELLKYIPDVWAPKNPALAAGMYKGGSTIPGEILGPLLLQCIYMFIFLTMCVFAALVMIRPFIEVEKLTFPSAVVITQTFKLGQESALTSFAKNKAFYIFFIVGLAIAVQSTINYFYPILPVWYVWGRIPLVPLDQFLRSLNPSIQEWWALSPSDAIMLFIAPLDVTASAVIWGIFKCIIWPFIAVGSGLIPRGAHPDTGPIKLGWFVGNTLLALGFWSVIFRWDVWSSSFKSLFKGAWKAAGEGRLSERMMWAGLVGSWLIYLLLFVALGAHAGFVLLFLLIYFFAFVGQCKVWGECSMWPIPGADWLPPRLVFQTAYSLGVPNPWPSTTWWATKAATRISHHIPQATWFPWGPLTMYKAARDSGTSERDLFIGQLIAVFLASFVGLPMCLALLYAYGADVFFTKTPYIKVWGTVAGAREVPGVVTAETLYSPVELAHFAATFVVVGALWYLRARFPWFLFNPVGLYLGEGTYLVAALPALVIKLLVLKTLGVSWYERNALPAAIGLLIGISFGAFVFGSAAALIR
ncbi:MAG: hypothetical protein LM590_16255 [Thermofilum sp.]|nr:hypothetical protein [Thermofilum sp.]